MSEEKDPAPTETPAETEIESKSAEAPKAVPKKAAAEKPTDGKKAGMFENFDFNTTIQQLWNGGIPLVQTFWFYYFGVIFVLHFLAKVIPGFFVLELVWAGFMVKPIFVAAEAYKGPSHWALLAKIAAVLIGLSVVSTLFF